MYAVIVPASLQTTKYTMALLRALDTVSGMAPSHSIWTYRSCGAVGQALIHIKFRVVEPIDLHCNGLLCIL